MDTNEILSKLAYLEKLEREFKEAHSNLSPSDIFDFYKKNNWPIVTELQTPLGVLTVLDETGAKVPFLVSYSYWFLQREDEELERFKKVLDNISAMLTINIDVAALEKRKIYRVYVSGEKLQYEDGDEFAECYTKIMDNKILALQRPVPNDFDYWDTDSLVNFNFEDKNWKKAWRYITICDENGFYFILKERKYPVKFDIAWMNMDGIGEYDCSDALSFYLT